MITHRSEPYEIDCVIQFPYIFHPDTRSAMRFGLAAPKYSVVFYDAQGCKHRASTTIAPIVRGLSEGLLETFQTADAHNITRDRLLHGVRAVLSVRDLTYEVVRDGQLFEGKFIGLDSLSVNVLELRDRLATLVQEPELPATHQFIS